MLTAPNQFVKAWWEYNITLLLGKKAFTHKKIFKLTQKPENPGASYTWIYFPRSSYQWPALPKISREGKKCTLLELCPWRFWLSEGCESAGLCILPNPDAGPTTPKRLKALPHTNRARDHQRPRPKEWMGLREASQSTPHLEKNKGADGAPGPGSGWPEYLALGTGYHRKRAGPGGRLAGGRRTPSHQISQSTGLGGCCCCCCCPGCPRTPGPRTAGHWEQVGWSTCDREQKNKSKPRELLAAFLKL